MFSASDVEVLFAETGRAVQRSLLLLDEHQPPPGAEKVSVRGDGATAAVRALRGLGSLCAFLSAAPAMAARLQAEAAAPLPAVQRQRRRGVAYPLLRRVVPGLRVGGAWGQSAPACQLWWTEEAGSGEGGGATTAAHVAGLLLSAALCAEVAGTAAECVTAAGRSAVRPAAGGATLAQLLSADATALPSVVRDGVTARVSSVLLSLSPPQPLPAGLLLLVPGWAAHVAAGGSPTLASQLLLRPLSAVAAGMLERYLRSEWQFATACAQCLDLTSAVAAQVLTALPEAVLAGEPRRLEQLLHRLYDALLLPLEETFTATVARPGMARALRGALARPFAERHKPALLRLTTAPARGCSPTSLASIFHTVHYRLLLLVETVGRAELSREGGCGPGVQTAAQQRKYEGLLRASEGKITVNLLSTIAEDRRLVMEATSARSPSGHVIYRLHDGSDEGGGELVVYLYVDNGAVLLRAGRARTFTAAGSVEEIFRPFTTA